MHIVCVCRLDKLVKLHRRKQNYFRQINEILIIDVYITLIQNGQVEIHIR